MEHHADAGQGGACFERRLGRLLAELGQWGGDEELTRYLLGRSEQLAPFPDRADREACLIPGCQYKLWLWIEHGESSLHLYADSDSRIVRGLAAVVTGLLDGLRVDEIAAADFAPFWRTPAMQNLGSSRNNLLKLAIGSIRMSAQVRVGFPAGPTKSPLQEQK